MVETKIENQIGDAVGNEVSKDFSKRENFEQTLFTMMNELKERLDATNYTKFYDFRRFVIDKSLDEINQYSEDINVKQKNQSVLIVN